MVDLYNSLDFLYLLFNRFFAPQEILEDEETNVQFEENGNTSQTHIYTMEDVMEDIADDDEECNANQKEPVKSEWAWGDPEQQNSVKVSALDRLQNFQYHGSKSIPTLSKRIKVVVDTVDLSGGVKKEAKEGILFYAKPGKKDEGLSQDDGEISNSKKMRVETKASNSPPSSQSSTSASKGRGAFSWGGKKADKGKKKRTMSMNLDIFRSTYSAPSQRSKMEKFDKETNEKSRTGGSQDDDNSSAELNNEQYSQISMGDSQVWGSQCSNSVSQSSNMYSMDADAFSYSQVGLSRPDTPQSSQPASQSQSSDRLSLVVCDNLVNSQPQCRDDGKTEQNQMNSDNDYAKVTSLGMPSLPSLGELDEFVDKPSQEDRDSQKVSTSSQPSLPNSQSVSDLDSQKSGAQDLFSKKNKLHHFYSVPSMSSAKAKDKSRVTGKVSSYFSKDRTICVESKETQSSQDEKSSSPEDASDATSEEEEKKKDVTDLTEEEDDTEQIRSFHKKVN